MWDTEGHVVTNYHVSVVGPGLSCMSELRDGDVFLFCCADVHSHLVDVQHMYQYS